ncbi:MAG: TIGR00297 family protein, partial [Cyanobacteriota bacterium]|nr:TIGR00297 family protein [Cyanobacteriota bacterium]
LLGAIAQNKISWLSNELVNGLQTSFAAVFAIAIAAWLGLAA